MSVVVVEQTPDESSTDVVIEPALDHEHRITILETTVAELTLRVSQAQYTADDAQTSADVAGEIAVTALSVAEDAEADASVALEATAEIIEASPDAEEIIAEVEEDIPAIVEPMIPDTTPKKSHWLTRSLGEWRSKIGD